MKSDTLTFQVLFWSFIGPFICLFSLFVFYIKSDPTPDYFPVVLLIGVPFCWKWRLRGFALSSVILCALLGFYYLSIPLEERFWHLGMGLSMAISLLITALSFEEVEALVEGMKLESRSRLENLWKVDEKLQQAMSEMKKKKEKIRESAIKIISYQKLLDRSTEDLMKIKEQHEKVIDELCRVNKEKEELLFSLSQVRAETSFEGRDNQLRLRYEETLDQLNAANEQLQQLQNEREGGKVYELSEIEEALEKQLLKTEQEREQGNREYQREIDLLQDVLASALKPDSEKTSSTEKIL